MKVQCGRVQRKSRLVAFDVVYYFGGEWNGEISMRILVVFSGKIVSQF